MLEPKKAVAQGIRHRASLEGGEAEESERKGGLERVAGDEPRELVDLGRARMEGRSEVLTCGN